MAGDPDPFDMLKPIKPKSAVPKPRGGANGSEGAAETLEEFASSGGATSTEETEKKTEELLERINEIVGALTDLFDARPEPWIDEPPAYPAMNPECPSRLPARPHFCMKCRVRSKTRVHLQTLTRPLPCHHKRR